MGLIGDIEETKKLWKGASPIYKLIIVLSAFLAVSSVASLADKIFAWKGFILDAVQFYRLFISKTFGELALSFDLRYSQNNLDYLIVGGIIFSTTIRWFWRERKPARGPIKNIAVTALMLLFFAFTAHVLDASSVEAGAPSFLLFIEGFILLPIIFDVRDKMFLYLPVIVSVLLVLILGAVNSGLSQ